MSPGLRSAGAPGLPPAQSALRPLAALRHALTLKHKLVVEQHANALREFGPDEIRNASLPVQLHQLLQEVSKRLLFGQLEPLINLRRVRRIESKTSSLRNQNAGGLVSLGAAGVYGPSDSRATRINGIRAGGFP